MLEAFGVRSKEGKGKEERRRKTEEGLWEDHEESKELEALRDQDERRNKRRRNEREKKEE